MVTLVHPYWTFKYKLSDTQLLVVKLCPSTEMALVNFSNFALGHLVLSNKSVYKLSYSSFGVNLTIDGLTTVPSTAPPTYTNFRELLCLICKVTFCGISFVA